MARAKATKTTSRPRDKSSSLAAEPAASPRPAASPVPEVIALLRKVDRWRALPDAEKQALLASIRIILSTWEANQDPKEIAALLGLTKRRKKPARNA